MATRVVNPLDPGSDLGNAIKNLGSSFFSGPNPLQQEAAASRSALEEAQRQKVQLETAGLSTKQGGIRQLADVVAKGMGFDPAAASSAAVLGGYDPSQLAALKTFQTGNDPAATDAQKIASLVGGGKTIGQNDAVSLGGQTDLRNAIASIDLNKETTLHGMDNASAQSIAAGHDRTTLSKADIDNAMAQLIASQGNAAKQRLQDTLPVNTGAGDITTFAPGDQRGGVLGSVAGMPTESTAKGGLLNRAAMGAPLSNVVQAVLGGMEKANNPANPAELGKNASPVGKLIAERDALPPGDPNRAAYDAAIAKATQASNGVTVSPDGTVTVGGSLPSKMTEAQATALGRGAGLMVGDDELDALAKEGYASPSTMDGALMTSLRNPADSMLGSATQSLQRGALSDQASRFNIASRNFVDAFGRIRSGAAILPSEWASFETQTIPQPNDPPSALAYKSAVRKVTRAAVDRASGYADADPKRVWEEIKAAAASVPVNVGEQQAAPAAAAPSQAAPPAPAAVAAPAAPTGPPPMEAVVELHNDPSPEAQAEFDAVFGPGAAQRALTGPGAQPAQDPLASLGVGP